MARPEEGTEVRSQIEDYVAPVLAAPTTDDRPLTVAALVRLHGRSRNTWTKYGAAERLQSVDAFRAAERAHAPGHQTRKSVLDEARADAAHWEAMYRELLMKWTIVEAYFLHHRTVALDEILARGLYKPDRSRPG